MKYALLKALVEASFNPDEPRLRVPVGQAQAETLEALRQAIRDESPNAYLSRWDNRPVLLAAVELPAEDVGFTYGEGVYATRVHVFFSGEDLQVAGMSNVAGGVPLAGVEQLRRLLANLREKLLDEQRQHQKQTKIRKLKERSIETQIAALAARMRFAYALTPMHNKVKLAVRLDDQNALFVDIPYSRFQEIIPGLEPLIDRVRELYGSGVLFKITSSSGVEEFLEPGPA